MYAIRSYYEIVEKENQNVPEAWINSLQQQKTDLQKEMKAYQISVNQSQAQMQIDIQYLEQKQYLDEKLITPAYDRFVELVAEGRKDVLSETEIVITSYSIHYTKLYECRCRRGRWTRRS